MISGLDVFVEPLRRLCQRGNTVRLASPYTNHRDDQKDEGSQIEKHSTKGAARNGANHAKDGLNYKDSDMEGQAL